VIYITVSDTDGGVASIAVLQSDNAVVTSSFEVGTTSPVVVSATRQDPTRTVHVVISPADVAGNSTSCDPIVATLVAPSSGDPVGASYGGIPDTEHLITLQNGDPGLDQVQISVNGMAFEVGDLQPNEVRVLDVASAMQPGDSNAVLVRGQGAPGQEIDVLIADMALSAEPAAVTPSPAPTDATSDVSPEPTDE
jgi:hypothetical protein